MNPAGSERFVTTCWTKILPAAETCNAAAREEFARLYWMPLYGLARRRGCGAADAEDAVQGFLVAVFERGLLKGLTPEGGRLRDYLRTAFERRLIDEHRARDAAKRRPEGGFLAVDGLDPESRLALEPADGLTPEFLFDRMCARSLLDAARREVAVEYQERRQEPLFEHLWAFIDRDPDRQSHAAAATALGRSEEGIRNEVTRLRNRFRKAFRDQVGNTLDQPDSSQVDAEIRCLMQALQAGSR